MPQFTVDPWSVRRDVSRLGFKSLAEAECLNSMLNCLEKEVLFRCTRPCLVLVWERIKPDVAQVLFYFFPLMQTDAKSRFPTCYWNALWGYSSNSVHTRKVHLRPVEPFVFWGVHLTQFVREVVTLAALGISRPLRWQPESMSRKGGVHAVHNSFLVSKTRRFRETFQIAFDSDFWVAVAMAF